MSFKVLQEIPIDPIIEVIRKHQSEVNIIYLFGSYAKGQEQESSDIDLAIQTQEPMSKMEIYQLRQELAARLNRDVDLIDMEKASAVLKNEVVQGGKRLYCAPHFERKPYELRIISEYLDFQEGTRDLREAIQKRGYVHG